MEGVWITFLVWACSVLYAALNSFVLSWVGKFKTAPTRVNYGANFAGVGRSV